MTSPRDATTRIEALTLALCAIPSVTGDEARCADAVEVYLRATPLQVERIGHTVLARSRPGGPAATGERPLVLLVGHTDTVPPHPEDGPVRRVGGRIYGLGASDMKGGLAVMLTLAERLDLDALPYRLGLVFYDREEGPWAASGLGPALEATPWLHEARLAFCLEPSDNVVQVGCMGSLHVRARFTGQASHSARPWQGRNAVHAAGPLLTALGARAPHDVLCGGFTFREVLSATLASGGRARNVIPDGFDLNLNLRFAPGRSLEEAEHDVYTFVAEALGATPTPAGVPLRTPDGVEVRLTSIERAPSGRVVTDNPLLQRFVAENSNVVAAKQAWTDVARLGAEGIDAVNLGPGLAAQAHQAGEYADIALLHASYQQFWRFLTGRRVDDTGG